MTVLSTKKIKLLAGRGELAVSHPDEGKPYQKKLRTTDSNELD